MAEPTLNTAYLNGCLDRWKQGDCAGRDALVSAAGARLEPLARKMLKGFPKVRRWEETGDVLQNSILRLLRTLENIRPASTRDFFNLAALHIRRELLDLCRHHRNRISPADLGDSSGEAQDRIPDRSDEGKELERWGSFHLAVEELPAEEREVVGLIFYHGWSQSQVAELFGISDRTVRRRWEDAMMKLRVVLE